MPKVDIINCSFSTLPGVMPIKVIENEIKKALGSNIVFVTAAGNCGPLINTINTLSQIRGVITVGSCNTKGDRLSSFSSRGVPNTDLKPTVITHGEDLFFRSKVRSEYNYTPEEIQNQIMFRTGRKVYISKEEAKYYIKISGTSFAASAISGCIIKILEMRKALCLEWTPSLIKNILENMAIPMSGYEEHEVGSGFIDYETIKNYFKIIDNSLFPNYYWGNCKVLERMWTDATGGGLKISNYLSLAEISKLMKL